MKVCGVTTLLDGKKMNEDQGSFEASQHCWIGRNTMKLCVITTLLNEKTMNEDNEALLCHSIVLW